MAYYSIEPWGFEIGNWRAAIVAQTMAEINRDREKNKTPFLVSDFYPVLGGDGEDQGPELPKPINAALLYTQFAAATGGTPAKKKK